MTTLKSLNDFIQLVMPLLAVIVSIIAAGLAIIRSYSQFRKLRYEAGGFEQNKEIIERVKRDVAAGEPLGLAL